MQELKDFWTRYEPYKLHPDDEEYLKWNKDECCIHLSIEELRNQYGNNLKYNETNENFKKIKTNIDKILTNLLVVPFFGNVLNAKIYILMNNPGFETGDYVDEHEDIEYINLIKQNLKLELNTFMCLHKDAIRTGGYNYWSNSARIPKIAKEYKRISNMSYEKSLEIVKDSISIIETIPYHSSKLPRKEKLLLNMPSSCLIKKFVSNYVMERVQSNKAMIFVWRGAIFWDIKEQKNVIIRKTAQQNGYLWDNEVRTMVDFLQEINL